MLCAETFFKGPLRDACLPAFSFISWQPQAVTALSYAMVFGTLCAARTEYCRCLPSATTPLKLCWCAWQNMLFKTSSQHLCSCSRCFCPDTKRTNFSSHAGEQLVHHHVAGRQFYLLNHDETSCAHLDYNDMCCRAMAVLVRSMRYCLTSEGEQAVVTAVIALLALQVFVDGTVAVQVWNLDTKQQACMLSCLSLLHTMSKATAT